MTASSFIIQAWHTVLLDGSCRNCSTRLPMKGILRIFLSYFIGFSSFPATKHVLGSVPPFFMYLFIFWLRIAGKLHPWQVARQPLSLTFTPKGNLELPTNLTPLTALDYGRKLDYLDRTHADMRRTCKLKHSTQKGPGLMVESNSGPSCCANHHTTVVRAISIRQK